MKIGIAGAGIMGQLLALEFANIDYDVSIFEKRNKTENDNCSMAAAGLLTPVAELDKCDSIIFELGTSALREHWPRIVNQVDSTIYFKNNGSLVVSHAQDESELIRFMQAISHKMPKQEFAKKITKQEISSIEPEITKFSNGYYLAQEGHIDNQSLLLALRNYLITQENIAWSDDCEIIHIDTNIMYFKDFVKIFDLVLDCRGLSAKDHYKDLRALRGEAIWLHAPQVTIKRPIRLMHPRYCLYIVPRPDHVYIIGASEIEAEDYSQISVRTTLELLSAAYSVHPGFSEARIIKTATQCRPTLNNHLPQIKFNESLIAVNGLYRHGFLIAPSLAEEVRRGVQEGFSWRLYPQLWSELT
jgi:glycine oxidase